MLWFYHLHWLHHTDKHVITHNPQGADVWKATVASGFALVEILYRMPSLIPDSSRTEVRSRSAVRSQMLELMSWNQKSAARQSESAVHLHLVEDACWCKRWTLRWSDILNSKALGYFYRVGMDAQNESKALLCHCSWIHTRRTSLEKDVCSIKFS